MRRELLSPYPSPSIIIFILHRSAHPAASWPVRDAISTAVTAALEILFLSTSPFSPSFYRLSQKLSEIKGLSEAKVDKMVEAAKALTAGFDWTSAREVEAVRARDVLRISLGAPDVDSILGGGVETQAITEVYGEYRTGKTQLCHTLCVTAQLPVGSGGAAGKVAYIDAEGTFRPDRIRPIAARFGLDADAVLDNILHARAFTFEQQDALLDGLAAKMAEEPIRLVIIDSLTANLRVDYQASLGINRIGRGRRDARTRKRECAEQKHTRGTERPPPLTKPLCLSTGPRRARRSPATPGRLSGPPDQSGFGV